MVQQSTQHADTSNGENGAVQKSTPPLRRSTFRALVQDFPPFWFTWCMNAGICGILTHLCPYQFDGLLVISTIFYVFDLVLFVFFSVILILRFVLYRMAAFRELSDNQSDLMFGACWPIAFMTLTTLTGIIPSNAFWGGHALSIVAYVMWWFVCGWNLVFLFTIFIILIQNHTASDRRMPTMIILPAVSVSTIAVTGATVVSLSFEVSPRLAVPVIIVSFLMVGIGILMGFMLTTYLFHGFLAHGWPATPQTASVFILIGPMGQSAAALQQLGQAANIYGNFGGYNKGTFLTAEAAAPLEAACMLVALLLCGLGIIWTVFSLYVMIYRAVRRELKWTPGWNAIIFPTGTLVTSFSLFAIEMDSPTFRVITAGLIIILVFMFLVNLIFTTKGIIKGELLVQREDPRVKKMMEENQKER